MRISLLMFAMLGAAGNLAAQPPEGSKLPPDENNCATCHAEEGLWEGETLRLYVPQESLVHDVHWLNGVNCHDCHGGDPGTFEPGEAHAIDLGEDAVAEPVAEAFKRAGDAVDIGKIGTDAEDHGLPVRWGGVEVQR